MDLTTASHRIEVGIRELKNQLSRYVDEAMAGTEIIVTEHGKPVARLSALTEVDTRLQKLIDSGAIRPALKPKSSRTRGRIRTKSPISELVSKQRG
ncbi:MAG: type II toxin-antitoxin system prevent-host-death family antitoxin [Ilumatobacteraceae bacterium]